MTGLFREFQESRPLRVAVLASLLWHLVWLFVIFIDVEDPVSKAKLEPKIYFVGPILTDDAFNMILEVKPEFSTTTYRSGDLSSPTLEPQPQEMERPDPGDLVSVPLGQSTWSRLRGKIQGEKPYPQTLFRKKLAVKQLAEPPFPITGSDLKGRALLSVPVFPRIPIRGEALRADPEYELTVSGAGIVTEARLEISSGDPEVDRVLGRYLSQWQFVPLEERLRATSGKGRVRVPLDTAGTSA